LRALGREIGRGRQCEGEVPPAGGRTLIVTHRLTQLHRLTTARALVRFAETDRASTHFMKRPGFGRPIANGFCGSEAPVESDRPRAPSRTDDQGAFEQPAKMQDFSPSTRVDCALLDAQERLRLLQ
jgi:hypothetical protein